MNMPPKKATANTPSMGHVQTPSLQNTTARNPVAPPVYRPQPVPKVLQTKRTPGQLPQLPQAQRQPVGQPIYRPEVKIVQPKTISPQRNSPTPPTVYRPPQKGVAQPKNAVAAPAHTMAKTFPVY